MNVHAVSEHISARYEFAIKKALHAPGWVCEIPDIPGCIAFGKSRVEALKNGEACLQTWITRSKEIGQPLPEPGSGRTLQGEIKLRLPRNDHSQLSNLAQSATLSLNETVNRLIRVGLTRLNIIEGNSMADDQLICLCGGSFVERKSAKSSLSKTVMWMQRLPKLIEFELHKYAAEFEITANVAASDIIKSELARLDIVSGCAIKIKNDGDILVRLSA